MVEGFFVFFHKKDCNNMVLRFLNLGGHEHFIIGSKLTTILMVFFVRNWMFVAAGQTVWIGDFWSKSIFLILETSDPFCLFAVWMIFFIWFFLGFLVIAELWLGFSAWLVWTNEKAKRSFEEWTCLHHKVSPLSNDPVPLQYVQQAAECKHRASGQ